MAAQDRDRRRAARGRGRPRWRLPGLAVVAAVALLLAVLLRAVGSYAATVCFALIGSRVTTTLRDRTYDRLLNQSVAYHQRNKAGDLLSRLTADIMRIQEVAVTAGLPLLANVITFVGMLVLDPLLAAVVLVAVPLFAFGAGRTGEKVTTAARTQRKAEGHIAGLAGEALGSVRVMQSYRLEEALRRVHQLPQERVQADAQRREVHRADQPGGGVGGARGRGARRRAGAARRLLGPAAAPRAR
ncbi:MAG: hypothetical protein L0H64_19140 [Pseudonocardia sp.]|nr:hypothetical protein [Pseudonocardia sp.]